MAAGPAWWNRLGHSLSNSELPVVKITIEYSSQIWPGWRDKLPLLDRAWGRV